MTENLASSGLAAFSRNTVIFKASLHTDIMDKIIYM